MRFDQSRKEENYRERILQLKTHIRGHSAHRQVPRGWNSILLSALKEY